MADRGERNESPVLWRDGESLPDSLVKIIISPLALVPAHLIRVLAILGWLPPDFLASASACQSLFDPFLLPRFEIKGVLLSFFYNVFL